MQILNSGPKTTPKILGMPAAGPFSLDDDAAYQQWREGKLSAYPVDIKAERVEIENPLQLSGEEKDAIIGACRKTNMALYRFKHPCGDPDDKSRVKKLAQQLGLSHLDSNLCADTDGISSLRVTSGGRRHTYIPYSNHKISWHTDGYYNPPEQQIRAMLLHCVSPAARGGVNALLDPEIAYIHLRDRNPDYIYALMQPQAMTIPANEAQGALIRAAQSGPVFSVSADGNLHMRYTARTRSIEWRDDETTRAAVACLSAFLNSDVDYVFQHKLEAGEGLICNNVLHNRSAFEDEGEARLLYRARYRDRLRET